MIDPELLESVTQRVIDAKIDVVEKADAVAVAQNDLDVRRAALVAARRELAAAEDALDELTDPA